MVGDLMRSAGLSCLLLGLCATPARAGGLWLWELGNAASVGLAGAHWGAGSDDASTAWTNPAAMTLVERSEVGGQLSPSFTRLRFDPNSSTSNAGSDVDDSQFIPLLAGAGVWAVTPDLRLGFALGGLAGGAINYGSAWAGRYTVTRVDLNVLGAAPGFAWRVRDWLSVGGNVILGYGALAQEANVNNLLPGQGDGKLHYEDGDFGVGGTVGVLLQPAEGTRIGITYRAPLDLRMNDRVDFENVEPPLSTAVEALGLRGINLTADLKMPQQVLVGLQQQLTEDLALVVNADWQDWSQFGAIEVAVASDTVRALSTDIQSQDTWHVGVGLRWQATPKWLLTTGFGYDSSAFDTSDRSPALPVDRQIRVGAGVQYELSEDLALGFAYTYANLGRAPIQHAGGPLQGQLYGNYDRNELHVFTLSVNWRP